jgi:hypothetical protein
MKLRVARHTIIKKDLKSAWVVIKNVASNRDGNRDSNRDGVGYSPKRIEHSPAIWGRLHREQLHNAG